MCLSGECTVLVRSRQVGEKKAGVDFCISFLDFRSFGILECGLWVVDFVLDRFFS
jgi:hypothetical protein